MGLWEGCGVALAEADGLGLTEALGLAEGSSLGEALGEADGSSLGSAEGEALGSSLGEALGLAEGSSVGDGLADSVAEGPGEAVGISAEDVEFCGSEASLKIKSLLLLFVSSPFPPLTSAPEVILSAVDPELAFLSILWPAPGFWAGEVSEVTAVPIPTLSTKVPLVLSVYKDTVLLSAIELA